MLIFVTVIHVLVCVFMMFVILLQPGKDAGMGAALGGGAATSAFGGRGAVTFLSKLTAACAVVFFITSLGLSFVGLRQSVAVTAAEEEKPAQAAPAKGQAAAQPSPGQQAPAAVPSHGVEQPSGAPPSTNAAGNPAGTSGPTPAAPQGGQPPAPAK